MDNQTSHVIWMYRQARKIVIFVIGSTILLAGIAMIVLPGPALVVIPIGLAILATEFVWARLWLKYARQHAEYAKDQVMNQLKSRQANQKTESNEVSR